MRRRKKAAPPPPPPRPWYRGPLGVAGALALVVLALRMMAPTPRPPLERLPAGPKTVRFRVRPPVARTTIAVVEPDGSQMVFRPDQSIELTTSGALHWTVHAPGYRAESGRLELPHGAMTDEQVVEVTLTSGRRAP